MPHQGRRTSKGVPAIRNSLPRTTMQFTYIASLAGATAIGVALGLGAASNSPIQSTTQEAAATTNVQEAGSDEVDPMMAAMMRAGQPGEHHAMLAPTVGNFDCKMTMVMNGEEMPGAGVWRSKWSMDGRFVEGDFSMDMPEGPYLGHGITGYSNLDQTFKSIWYDNMNTNISYSAGFASEDGKTITFLGADPNPMTGEVEDYTDVVEIQDENHHVFTRYMTTGGERGDMTMRIEYTRQAQ